MYRKMLADSFEAIIGMEPLLSFCVVDIIHILAVFYSRSNLLGSRAEQRKKLLCFSAIQGPLRNGVIAKVARYYKRAVTKGFPEIMPDGYVSCSQPSSKGPAVHPFQERERSDRNRIGESKTLDRLAELESRLGITFTHVSLLAQVALGVCIQFQYIECDFSL